MRSPVANCFKIIQKFGKTGFARQHPDWYEAFGGIHPGLDFGAPSGTEVSAALSGYVVRREHHRGMGNVVAVRTGNIYALYAHLSKFEVSLGDYVEEGTRIGLSGATGAALTEPHLHFEFRDLTKRALKDRVFAPIFGSGVPRQFRKTFSYRVRDRKTLSDLALKFFGSRTAWLALRRVNPKMSRQHPGWVIKLGTRIRIPLR